MTNGYFVRTPPPGGPDAGRRLAMASDEPVFRHRRRFPWRKVVVLALLVAVAGWLAWASRTDGGVSARVEDGIASIERATGLDDTDPTLRTAEETYQEVWEAKGNYLVTPEELEVREPNVDWVSDLNVHDCPGGRAVVLVVRTASGTRSRLLLDGETRGDVEGDTACPVDYVDPAPWD